MEFNSTFYEMGAKYVRLKQYGLVQIGSLVKKLWPEESLENPAGVNTYQCGHC